MLLITHAQAQPQQRLYTEFNYDQIGNIEQIVRDISGVAPQIDSVSPLIVRESQVVNVIVDGQGLRGAILSNNDGIFQFSNIQSSDQQLTFTLEVAEDVELNSSPIEVSTGLGAQSFDLQVFSELPQFLLSPLPIILKQGETLSLPVSLSQVDALPHELSITNSDDQVATVNVNSISILAGELFPNQSIVIEGLELGKTELRFQSPTLGEFDYLVSVVGSGYSDIPGIDGQVRSFQSGQLGINKLFVPSTLIEQQFFSPTVSIVKEEPDSPVLSQFDAVSTQLSISKGAYISGIEPQSVSSGETATLLIQGSGLQNGQEIQFVPADGVAINNFTPNADGLSASVNVTVDEGIAAPQIRQLQYTVSSGEIIPPQNIGADRVYIGGSTPIINSVSPIFFNRNDVRQVTVQGENLFGVTSVTFDNMEGLNVSTPVINNTGTTATFNIQIAEFALLGGRRMVLKSLNGDSEAVNINANEIFIEDRPPVIITPAVSPIVGLIKSTEAQPLSQFAVSESINILKGQVVQQVMPNSRSVGSNFVLTIEGFGLSQVDTLEFFPNDGISISSLQPASSGETVTAQISIANDAPATIRQLKLTANGINVPFSSREDRFEIVLEQAEVDSIQPQQVVKGTSTAFTVRGVRLVDVNSISVIPSDGIIIGSIEEANDGRSVQAQISVSDDAVVGQRIVVVNTNGGSTSSEALPMNTFSVIDEIQLTVTPVLTPIVGLSKLSTSNEVEQTTALSNYVGINKQVTIVPVTQERFQQSPLVGLVKGARADVITPNVLPIGSNNQTIVISGNGLNDVSQVEITPIDGITFNGEAIISTSGDAISINLSVASDSPQTLRNIELQKADGSIIPFVELANANILIAGNQPIINSITPIQETRGANFVMTIRGINFDAIQSVSARPANGISFGTPNVSPAGDLISVPVSIDLDAIEETKVIIVTTSAGESIEVSMPSNTFNVISN